MSIHELLRKHSYDLVVFLPFSKLPLTLNLWAGSEEKARRRVIQELGGEGAVQILECRQKITDRSSGGLSIDGRAVQNHVALSANAVGIMGEIEHPTGTAIDLLGT